MEVASWGELLNYSIKSVTIEVFLSYFYIMRQLENKDVCPIAYASQLVRGIRQNNWICSLFFLLVILAGCSESHKKAYQGYIETDNIYLASPYSGILEQLFVKRGQQVKKGQTLFQLDKNPQLLTVEEYKGLLSQATSLLHNLQKPRRQPEIEAIMAQIERVKANKALAELRVKRMKALYEKNAVNQDTVDEAIARYQEQNELEIEYQENLKLAQMGGRKEEIAAQKAQVESLFEKLNNAKWALQQKHIVAPEDGIIFDTYYVQGEFVGSEQAVVALLTHSNVHVEFFVPAEIVSQIQLGQTLEFQATERDDRGKAVISYISPEAEYMPPLIYSRDNNDKLIFRIQALLSTFNEYKPGQPVTVYLP